MYFSVEDGMHGSSVSLLLEVICLLQLPQTHFSSTPSVRTDQDPVESSSGAVGSEEVGNSGIFTGFCKSASHCLLRAR